MSTNIETLYVPTFKNNVELLAQQRVSRLEAYVTVQPCEGVACAVRDQYGQVAARKKTERHEKTKYSDTPRQRRWLIPQEFYTAEMYDKSDVMRMLTDPQSPLMMAHLAAMERAKDSVILQSFFAASVTGETVTSGTTIYNTANDIAADLEVGGTPAGLTAAKLIRNKRTFIANKVDVDAEVPQVLLDDKAWEDIFGQQTLTSGDYQNNKPIQSAPTAMYQGGANLISLSHDDFPVNGTSERYLPSWIKSGIVLGKWKDREVTVRPVQDTVSSWEIKIVESFAATRVDEKKVNRIKIKY